MPRDNGPNIDDLSEEIPPREVTLGTSTILGLFFALALVCAAFFGFGYTVGRKSSSTGTEDTPRTAVADGYKPPAGSPAIQAVPGYMSQQEADTANRATANQVYAPAAANTPAATNAPAKTTTPSAAPQTTAASPTPAKPTPAAPEPAPAPAPAPVQQAAAAPPSAPTSTTNFVQIAAVSRQDDADLLLKALRSRGYSVMTHQEADHLIHVQMGPFNSRKDAEAMRQRLLSDGYNAIVK